MSFFESIPQPPPAEPVRQRRPAWMRSDAVIPASVPAEVVLIRAEQVAVAVGSVRAYPNGFEFTVHIRLRGEAEASWPGYSDPFERHRPRRGTGWEDDQLRLGILYADGRRAATTGVHYRPPEDDDDGRLVLQQGGGGGSGCSQDWDFWVYPLPPGGPVILVASWAERGIAECRAELDGAAIRAAAGRAVTLWPEEPEPGPGGTWRSHKITGGGPDDLGTRAEPGRPGAEGTGAGG
jgi:hypothetical protein